MWRWFVQRGYIVFPLPPMRKAPPLIKGWPELTEPVPPRDGQNYGVLCNGVVVLDIDDVDLADRYLPVDWLCSQTLCVKTPHGGLHIYLRGRAKGRVAPWGEIRGERQYVVGPGSKINHLYCKEIQSKCNLTGVGRYKPLYVPDDLLEYTEIVELI